MNNVYVCVFFEKVTITKKFKTMKKRNQKICEMAVTAGAKIQCARFGTFTKTKFASGDDKNNVQVWKLGKEKPIVVTTYIHKKTDAQLLRSD